MYISIQVNTKTSRQVKHVYLFGYLIWLGFFVVAVFKRCYIIIRLVFANFFIAIFLSTYALTADVRHKPVKGLFSLTNEFIERFEISLIDIFQHACIDQPCKSFIQLTAGD